MKIEKTKLQNVYFHGCKISGVNFSVVNTLLLKVRFEDCLISECNFTALQLQETGFRNCRIHNCDFYQAILTGADFSGSDLKDSLFENTDLSKANFSEARNYIINPLTNKIKKARFSLPEAMVLLNSFEIILEE